MIHLREPPSILRPSETHSGQETLGITIIKLLLRSYYDIVRKTIEDSVPKAIIHFLVNHTKRELHNVFIKNLYRDDMIEGMLREPDEISLKRKRTKEMLRVLQQAFRVSSQVLMSNEWAMERAVSEIDCLISLRHLLQFLPFLASTTTIANNSLNPPHHHHAGTPPPHHHISPTLRTDSDSGSDNRFRIVFSDMFDGANVSVMVVSTWYLRRQIWGSHCFLPRQFSCAWLDHILHAREVVASQFDYSHPHFLLYCDI